LEDRSNSPFVDETGGMVPLLPEKQKDSMGLLIAATENLTMDGTPTVRATYTPSTPPSDRTSAPVNSTNPFKYIPTADGNKVLNLDLTTFLKGVPRNQTKFYTVNGSADLINNTGELFESMLFRHDSVQGILNSKLFHLQTIREVWSEDSIVPALETMVKLGDSSVVVDVLRVFNCKPKLINLEAATIILPMLSELLFAIYEEYCTLI
jgi:hypothetical protein